MHNGLPTLELLEFILQFGIAVQRIWVVEIEIGFVLERFAVVAVRDRRV